ncbi:MAG: polysaccharide biosynthesis/export family protein [Ferruginibacter sp.]
MILSHGLFIKLLSPHSLRFYILVCLLAGMISCTTTKQPGYFKTIQNDTTINGFISNNFESKIRAGDNLGITISSLSPEENIKFNSAGLIVTEKGTVPGYRVQLDGTIRLYRFGNVKAEGLTRREFAAKLHTDLLPYLKEPIVNVTYLNHRITMMGEVNKPQVINMEDEQLSVLEAIVLSGDVKENARREKIMIIRETDNEKKIKYVNLEDHSIFNSPWYYLQPNDIVYVLSNTEKTDKEERNRKLQTNFSLIASGTTLLIIILDRVFR